MLEDNTVQKYSAYLDSFEDSGAFCNADYTEDAYMQDCVERRETAASSFSRDNSGFSATISLPKDNLVFFSVPYEEGWSATVNGKPAEIVKANVGFMAVLCAKGDNVSIRFNYKTPGLGIGALISLGALAVFLLYIGLVIVFSRRKMSLPLPPEKTPIPPVEETPFENGKTDNPAHPADFDLYRYYPESKKETPPVNETEDADAADSPDDSENE